MARIGTYTTDDNVTGSDKVLGTDTGGSTKNYELDSIADYFSKNNTIAVGGQVIYLFKSSESNLTIGQFTMNNGGSDGLPYASVTDISINKAVRSNMPVSELLKKVFEGRFRLYGVTTPNDYYDFEVTRIEDHPTLDDTYFISVVPISGNSNSTLSNNEYYAFTPATGDLSYTHNQSSASNSWVITHNLGKKPSVTIQDSAGTDVHGEVEYNSDQKLTITFSSAFSGTAFLN